MNRYSYAIVAVGLISAAIAGADSQTIKAWTNHDPEKLRHPGLISIVGQGDQEQPKSQHLWFRHTSKPRTRTGLRSRQQGCGDEIQHREAQLREYRQALADARSLTDSPGGIDLVGEDFAITPEAGLKSCSNA